MAGDWIAAVAPRALWATTALGPGTASIADARLTNSNRIVYSTLGKQGGNWRLHSEVFDRVSNRLLREYTVTAAGAIELFASMAAKLVSPAYGLGAKNEEALRAWGAITSEEACLAVAKSNPGFAPAIASCLELLVAAGRRESVTVITTLIPDPAAQGFSPDVQFDYGSAFMALHDYKRAEVAFAKSAPLRPASRNMHGYALALLGECDASRKELELYAKVPGEEANGLDSLGEAAYFCNQYKAAADYFLQSAPKWPSPRREVEPLKAAAVRWLDGDSTGAFQLFAEHRAGIAKAKPELVAQLDALWQPIAKAATQEDRIRAIEATLIHRP